MALKANKNKATNTPLATPKFDRYRGKAQVMTQVLCNKSKHIFSSVLKIHIHTSIYTVKLKHSSDQKVNKFVILDGERKF